MGGAKGGAKVANAGVKDKEPIKTIEKTDVSAEEGVKKTSKSTWDSFLFTPVDISPLVYLRIIFGAIMLWEVYRHFNGRKQPTLERYYMLPQVHIQYNGFNWMPGPLPGMYMYHFFAVLGFLYCLLILGLWYRTVSILTFLGLFYWFCLDMFFWLNHLYFALMLNFILIFLPAGRNASLDVLIDPSLRLAKVPSWTTWLIKLTLAIPYIFGGISKIHMDWLRGEPMRTWAPEKGDALPDYVRNLLDGWYWTPYFFSWGGLIFDLFIVPLLLYQPTRAFASLNAAFFHLMNDKMFHIGIFPWLCLFSTPLFFEPETLRPVLNFEWIFARPQTTTNEMVESPKRRKIVKLLFCLWFGFHTIWPFRHHLYPGDVNWTEEAYLFSWQMKMRDKSGRADFTVIYKDTGEKLLVHNSDFLIAVQASRVSTRAEYILGYAHFLCKHYGKKRPVEVYVDSEVSYNARDYQPLVYSEVNLCEKSLSLFSTSVGDWIVPLTTPFESKRKETNARIEREGVAAIKKANPTDFVGQRVAQYVDKVLYFGTVSKHKPHAEGDRWVIQYDDGDREKLTRKFLARGLDLYSKKQHLDYKNPQAGDDEDTGDEEEAESEEAVVVEAETENEEETTVETETGSDDMAGEVAIEAQAENEEETEDEEDTGSGEKAGNSEEATCTPGNDGESQECRADQE